MVDYIEKIQFKNQPAEYLNSTCFKGQWVYNWFWLANPVRMAANTNYTYSLASYLPDDGYDYEVLFYFYDNTGGGNDQANYFYFRSGASNNYWIESRAVGACSRTASTYNNAGYIILPIKATNKQVTVIQDGNSTSGECWFGASYYRRIGKNTSLNVIDSIDFPQKTIKVGGYLLDSPWTSCEVNVVHNFNLKANNGSQIYVDLTPYLPNDDCDYEGLFDLSYTTSGAGWLSIQLKHPAYGEAWIAVSSGLDGGAGTCGNATSFITPIRRSQPYLILRNQESTTSNCIIDVDFEAYRRVGKHV